MAELGEPDGYGDVLARGFGRRAGGQHTKHQDVRAVERRRKQKLKSAAERVDHEACNATFNRTDDFNCRYLRRLRYKDNRQRVDQHRQLTFLQENHGNRR